MRIGGYRRLHFAAVTATPALAQVDVRVKIDTRAVKDAAQDVAREVRMAVQSALGPELRRDLQDAVRDLVESSKTGERYRGDLGMGQSQRFAIRSTTARHAASKSALRDNSISKRFPVT